MAKYTYMKRFVIGVIFIGTFFLLVNKFLPTLKDSECISLGKFKKLDINGYVTKKYIDSTQHSFPFIEVKQFASDTIVKVGLVGDKSNSYNLILVGDTIVKKMGSEFIRLKNSVMESNVKVDFGCKEN